MIIIQNGKPIYFYIRKLTDSNKRYTVTEKEMLIIVEILKQFRTILLDQILRIYTPNLSFTLVPHVSSSPSNG